MFQRQRYTPEFRNRRVLPNCSLRPFPTWFDLRPNLYGVNVGIPDKSSIGLAGFLLFLVRNQEVLHMVAKLMSGTHFPSQEDLIGYGLKRQIYVGSKTVLLGGGSNRLRILHF
jgi:hypothetical protein